MLRGHPGLPMTSSATHGSVQFSFGRAWRLALYTCNVNQAESIFTMMLAMDTTILRHDSAKHETTRSTSSRAYRSQCVGHDAPVCAPQHTILDVGGSVGHVPMPGDGRWPQWRAVLDRCLSGLTCH